jgi:hypothetical protein
MCPGAITREREHAHARWTGGRAGPGLASACLGPRGAQLGAGLERGGACSGTRLARPSPAPRRQFRCPIGAEQLWGADRSPPPPRKGDLSILPAPRAPPGLCGRAFSSPARLLPRARARAPAPPRARLPPWLAARSSRSLPAPRQSAEPEREPAREPERVAGDSAGGGGDRSRSQSRSARGPHPRRSGPSPDAGLRAACAVAARRPQPWPRPRCGARPASTPAPAAEAAAAAPGRPGGQNQARGARVARTERAHLSARRGCGLRLPAPGLLPSVRLGSHPRGTDRRTASPARARGLPGGGVGGGGDGGGGWAGAGAGPAGETCDW